MRTSAALAAAVLLCAAGVAAAGPARRGQVVRVERQRTARAQGVHLCFSNAASREYMVCVGDRAPRVGSVISVIGIMQQTSTSVVDRARVRRTEPAQEDRCQSGRLHTVYYDLETGAASGAMFTIGLTGVEFSSTTKVDLRNTTRPPEVDPGDQVLGLDADGDQDDLAITGKDCNGPGAPSARRIQCLRYWKGGGSSWKLIGEDLFVECGP